MYLQPVETVHCETNWAEEFEGFKYRSVTRSIATHLDTSNNYDNTLFSLYSNNAGIHTIRNNQ